MTGWLRARRDSRKARREAELRRKTYSGSVFQTQAQALTAATWVLDGGEEPPEPNVALRNLFLSNVIALGFGPRAVDADARAIWQLLALELGVSPVADYPTVPQFSMNPSEYLARGVLLPSYEFGAALHVSEHDIDVMTGELRNLSVAHRDDMPTMFLHQLAGFFGASDPAELKYSFKLVLLHAGFTMKTVTEDVEAVPESERHDRIDLASKYEARLLALAKRLFAASKDGPHNE